MSQTILLVEDDSDLRAAVVTLLEAEGFEVVTAPDGLAGLKLLERIREPSLILLDWWLLAGLMTPEAEVSMLGTHKVG